MHIYEYLITYYVSNLMFVGFVHQFQCRHTMPYTIYWYYGNGI